MKKQFLLGLMAMTLPLTSWAQTDVETTPPLNQFVVSLTDDFATMNEITYKGAATAGVKVDYSYKTPDGVTTSTLTENTHYTVSYSYKQDESAESKTVQASGIKDAGIYTVTVTGKGTYADDTPVSKTFTITKKALTLTDAIAKADAKIQYGTPEGTELEISDFVTLTSVNGLVTGDDEEKDALKCLSLTKEYSTGDAVGQAALMKVTASEKNGSNNYEYNGGDIFFKVDVDKKDLTLSLKEQSRVYNGAVTTAANLIDGLNFVAGDGVEATYSVMKDGKKSEIKNAGTYTIEVILEGDAKDNYNVGTSSFTYTIDRAPIEIKLKEGVELTKTYDGKEMTAEDTKNYFDISGIIEADKNDVKVTVEPSGGTKANVNAGETISLAPYVNGKQVQSGDFKAPKNLDNYYIYYNDGSTTLVKIEITKRTVKYYFAGGEKTYDGEAVSTPEYTVALIEENGTGFVGTTDGFETEPKAKFAKFAEGVTEAKNAGDYTLTEDTEENENIAFKNDSKNYTAAFVSDYTLAEGAEPANVNKYVIKKAEFTARVLDHEIHYAATKEAEETLKAELEDYLTITTGKTGYEGGNLTGKNIVRTSVAGTLVSEMNAIVNQLGKTLVVSEDIDFTKVGEYDIKFGVEAKDITAQNWNVTLTSGKLFIKGDGEIVLDGGDEPETAIADLLNIYDGATVDKVTIKNLKNFMGDVTGSEETGMTINAEQWYTLVLPFEVSVRDLSREFGYAIVNIPDEDNTSTDGAHFKLTMQTVPANTLMAFKVDQTMVWDANKEVVFTDKTIVAPGEDHVVCDKAPTPNYFIGVYEKKEINDYNDLYLLPTNGKFYHSSSTSKTIMIYPLNGYVHIGEANSARVYMQEADGSTTAINAVTGEVIRDVEGWYTVGGMKLNGEPTQKGVYINNGKKVVIK